MQVTQLIFKQCTCISVQVHNIHVATLKDDMTYVERTVSECTDGSTAVAIQPKAAHLL